MSMKIVMDDKSVQRGLFEWIGVVFLMDEECLGGAIDNQGFRPFLKEWMWWTARWIRRVRGLC